MSVFRRILFIYAALLLCIAIGVEVFVTRAVRSSHEAALAASIEKQIALVSDAIRFDRAAQDGGARLLKEKNGARITIIGSDGRVLGDSDHDSAGMDNHMGREEIQ